MVGRLGLGQIACALRADRDWVGHGQQGEQLGVQRAQLVGEDFTQGGVGDLARTRQHRYVFDGGAIGVSDDGRAEGVVAVVACEPEQLADAGLELGQLFAELFFQSVGFGRGGQPILEIEFVHQ